MNKQIKGACKRYIYLPKICKFARMNNFDEYREMAMKNRKDIIKLAGMDNKISSYKKEINNIKYELVEKLIKNNMNIPSSLKRSQSYNTILENVLLNKDNLLRYTDKVLCNKIQKDFYYINSGYNTNKYIHKNNSPLSTQTIDYKYKSNIKYKNENENSLDNYKSREHKIKNKSISLDNSLVNIGDKIKRNNNEQNINDDASNNLSGINKNEVYPDELMVTGLKLPPININSDSFYRNNSINNDMILKSKDKDSIYS